MVPSKEEMTGYVLSILENIPMDLRVEVVVTDLLKSGYSLNDFYIRPKGIFRRRFGKDIAEIEKAELKNSADIFFININREGFYDMLPQGLFHNPPGKGTKAFKQAAEMAEEVKIRKKEEMEARNFFLIYEIELYQQRLAIEWHERNLIETVSITMDDEDFLSYWELPAVFSKRQKGILFYLYPIIDNIRGNVKLMEKTYQLILGDPIAIKTVQKIAGHKNVMPGFNVIGNRRLGLDLVMGSGVDQSVFPWLLIEVGPLNNKKVADYLPRAKNWMVINELNRFFLPFYMEYKIKVQAEKSEWELGVEASGTRLGMNIHL